MKKQHQEYKDRIEELEKTTKEYAFSKHFTDLVRYLTVNDKSVLNISRRNATPRAFTNVDARKFKQQGILDFTRMQTPFTHVLELYAIKNAQGTVIDYDWDALYDWYKHNYAALRLTHITDGDIDEGLLKRLNDIVRKEDEEYEKLPIKQRKKLRKQHYDKVKFESIEDLVKFQKSDESKDTNLIVRGTTYKGLAEHGTDDDQLDVIGQQQIAPTLKEIDIKSPDDLRRLFNYMKNQNAIGNDQFIGFTYMDDLLTSMNMSYKTFSLNDNKVDNFIRRINIMSKKLMRLSPGFLMRNVVDTWNQLYSEIYDRHGTDGITSGWYTAKLFKKTAEIDHIYLSLNEERLLVNADLRKAFEDFMYIKAQGTVTPEHIETTKNILNNLYYELNAYEQGVSNMKDKSRRIESRSERVVEHIRTIEAYIDALDKGGDLNKIVLQDVENATAFLLDTRFGEFYLVQEQLADMMASGKIKHTNSTAYKFLSDVRRKYTSQEDRDAIRSIVSELSYFMETNAQLDPYRLETSKNIDEYIRMKQNEEQYDLTPRTYKEIAEEMDIANGGPGNTFSGKVLKSLKFINPLRIYDGINEYIERTGRIGGFLMDRFYFNQNINQAVSNSLKRFFNYGQMSPTETRLLQDIPYLSFPVRTINNWLSRVTNPRYLRLMDDFIDGIYSQYKDEDGQYSEYTEYQIANGWIPITDKIGLRMGNGAFDTLNIITNAGGQIEQRLGPMQRAARAALDGEPFGEVVKQLATVGVTTQLLNAATALTGTRELAQQTPGIKDMVHKRKPTLGNSVNMFYDVGFESQYTPKHYVNNGRNKYYDNIYKSWFTKYGKMRSPKVDPLYLVKDTMWKNYLRSKRIGNKYIK